MPNSAPLDLSAAGVQVDARGYIGVNERLETNVAGVYALGDVNGGPAFTHISYDDYRVVRNNLLRGVQSSTKDRMVPYAVFIDPQLGRVGLTEQEARANGRAIHVAKIPMTWVARAVETAETRGFIKAVVDAQTEQNLGGRGLGRSRRRNHVDAADCHDGQASLHTLEDAIFAHPTFAEGLNTLFMYMEH